MKVEDIKAYLESGILELYVLGDASAEEKLQVETLAAQYPAVRQELNEIELSLEQYASQHAITPSETLQNKILSSTLVNLGDDRNFTKPRKHSDEEVYEDDNVVNMPQRQNAFFKYAFAACLALLLVSVYAIYNLYSKLQDTNTQLTAMQLDRQRIANQVNLRDQELEMYQDTAFKVLRLQGTAKTPQSAMVLAWNPSSQKVMLDMRSMKLPAHDTNHQYQLWALVNGKPVDMGVFDLPANDSAAVVKEMKPIASAQAFAVTLEPTGGSVNPTLDQMVVLGKF